MGVPRTVHRLSRIDGDGNGAVWELGDVYAPEHKLPRKPRDFTEAVFKLRSTPSGSFPTDVDLFRSISRGLVADNDMPSFKFLPERDRWAVIAYIKTLSPRWTDEAEFQEDPLTIAEPPLPDPHMLTAARKCTRACSARSAMARSARGDGPSAPGLEDDSGLPIEPRDFTDAGQFVGDSSPKGVYQTFTTGLDGTPMPSFATSSTSSSAGNSSGTSSRYVPAGTCTTRASACWRNAGRMSRSPR